MDLFEKGYRLYGALYDGMEDPIRLKKASEIERFDPENLWAVPSKKIAAAISVRNMPASDTDYLSAVKKGDTATAQRMVDEAAKAAGYTVGVAEHRSKSSTLEGNAFDLSRSGNRGGVHAKFNNPAIWFAIPSEKTKKMMESLKSKGFPSPYGENVFRTYLKFDESSDFKQTDSSGTEIIAITDPSRIKSADPVTYDDAGNVIPLSQRFKATSEDIRYMPQPDSAMPGAYSFPGGYRALPGKAKGSLRLYGPAGSLIGIASSLDEAQRIIRKKAKQ